MTGAGTPPLEEGGLQWSVGQLPSPAPSQARPAGLQAGRAACRLTALRPGQEAGEGVEGRAGAPRGGWIAWGCTA